MVTVMDFRCVPFEQEEMQLLMSAQESIANLVGEDLYRFAEKIAQETEKTVLQKVTELLEVQTPLDGWGQREIREWLDDHI